MKVNKQCGFLHGSSKSANKQEKNYEDIMKISKNSEAGRDNITSCHTGLAYWMLMDVF